MGNHYVLQRNLPIQGIKPGSPALEADSLPSEPPGKPSVCEALSKYLQNEIRKVFDVLFLKRSFMWVISAICVSWKDVLG